MSVTVVDLVVKTVYHDDVRRFKLSEVSLVHLRDLISKTYEKLPSFSIRYTDPEGDVCSIGSDAELEEAFNVSGSTLKLDILPVDDGRASDVLPKKEAGTEKKKEVEMPKETKNGAEITQPKDEGKQDEGKQEEENCSAVCGLFLELVRDKDVQAKLPDIAQSVLKTLEKGEFNIKSIMLNVFTEIPSLRENAAVQKVLPVLVNHGEKN